jgi:hypothetical protein
VLAGRRVEAIQTPKGFCYLLLSISCFWLKLTYIQCLAAPSSSGFDLLAILPPRLPPPAPGIRAETFIARAFPLR